MRRGLCVLSLVLLFALPTLAQDGASSGDAEPAATVVAQSTDNPPIQDNSGTLQSTLEANDGVTADTRDANEAQLAATLTANDPPLNTSAFDDNSGDLQATLQANNSSKQNQLGTGNDESASLQATLEANDGSLVPDTTSIDVTDFLPSNILAENIHQILTIIALVIGFALVWKVRQNSIVDFNDSRKKKKV